MLLKVMMMSMMVSVVLKVVNLLNYSLLESEKMSEMECGLEGSMGYGGFMFKYYMVTLVFLMFDMELGLLWPVSREGYKLGDKGYMYVLVFVVVLTVGFMYEMNEKMM